MLIDPLDMALTVLNGPLNNKQTKPRFWEHRNHIERYGRERYALVRISLEIYLVTKVKKLKLLFDSWCSAHGFELLGQEFYFLLLSTISIWLNRINV